MTTLALARMGAVAHLFSSNYLPHRYCYLAQPWLVWTNVVMDGAIAASYAVIFLTLFWIAGRLRSFQPLHGYLWIFIAFGTFIVACGATHLMEVVTVWWPIYPFSALVKVVCAAASVPTAILFARAAPRLQAGISRFLATLSTTRYEKDQAMMALIASEKLAVAGRLSASIAHEIKNPLDAVGNLLYLLREDDRMPEQLRELVDLIAVEVEQMNTIAHNTLSLFKTSGSEATECSLSDIVQGVIDLQMPQMIKRNIVLRSRLLTPLRVKSYPGELRQILINLVQNAEAAIGTDGEILVRVQPRHMLAGDAARTSAQNDEKGRLRGQPGYSITIADSGCGIDESDRARLFTLFFTTKGDQGTGLGLWLVRSMVEKQGGRIAFRSRTAAESRAPGTIFNLWIPLEPSALPSLPVAAGSQAA
ncbi:MAG TPA: HAMP domain-containing sensor histidine kinase [Acidobacteriaceae bacterium]